MGFRLSSSSSGDHKVGSYGRPGCQQSFLEHKAAPHTLSNLGEAAADTGLIPESEAAAFDSRDHLC